MNQRAPSKFLNYCLWIVQVLLAASMIWASFEKLFSPIEKLAAMWPWAAEVPIALVKFTGIVDLLGGLGLVLPALLRIRPALTPLAAICLILLMICASVFHVSRGEVAQVGVNIAFALLAIFVAWGRMRVAPVTPK